MSRKFVSGGGYRLKGLGTTKVSSLKSHSNSNLHPRGIFHDISHVIFHGTSHFKPSALLTSLSLIALFALSAFSLSSILYPSVPSSANSSGSGASSSSTLAVGASVQEFLRLAVDVSEVALADSQGHTTISPDPNTGTQITGDINVAVTTNTGNGYNLTVATQDNTKNMSHSLPNVDATINSIDTISGYDASTGASSLSNNTWGFRKNTGTSEEPVYTNWYAVGAKDSTGTVIDSPGEGTGSYCDSLSYPLNQSGCNPSSYRTYNINVGAKLTSSLPAGTYTNDIVFSATTKSEGTKYTMNFNSNGGNNGNIINPRIVIAGLSTILPTSGFTKDGMGIKGWAFKSGVTPSTANTSADTTMYNAGQSVAINDLLTAALNAGQNPSTNNSFTVYAVWETAYTINFNKNSNEAIGSMNPDTPIIQSATYTIPTATFTREGYNFIGWALSSSTATAGTVAYTAGQTPTVSSLITAAQAAGQSVTLGTAGTITLYAIWEEATVYMQNFDCDSRLPNVGDYLTAKDSRGTQKEYTVKKLADGNCWMMENLSITNVVMTDQDTNLAPNATFDLTTGISQSGSSGWCTTNSDACDNIKAVYAREDANGYLYNWYTATASNGTRSTAANVTINYDICPKGWHLPVGGDNNTTNQFALLDMAINPGDSFAGTDRDKNTSGVNLDTQTASFNNMNNIFPLAGYISGSLDVGTYGFYWSSTAAQSNNVAYSLILSSSSLRVTPRSHGSKYIGYSVRCVTGD